jgi:hypothetical protein
MDELLYMFPPAKEDRSAAEAPFVQVERRDKQWYHCKNNASNLKTRHQDSTLNNVYIPTTNSMTWKLRLGSCGRKVLDSGLGPTSAFR